MMVIGDRFERVIAQCCEMVIIHEETRCWLSVESRHVTTMEIEQPWQSSRCHCNSPNLYNSNRLWIPRTEDRPRIFNTSCVSRNWTFARAIL